MSFDFSTYGHKVYINLACFFTWEELSNLCSDLLTSYFERSILAEAIGDNYGDSWSLNISDLTKEEITSLMDTLNLDNDDRDSNDFGVYPVQELSQSLCLHMVAQTLPFTVEASHSTGDGVWFTGKSPKPTV